MNVYVFQLILPYRRYEADQGNFCTVFAGSYKLVWDNSYSTFFKKVLIGILFIIYSLYI
uniref:GOLD domain-containing protein n=1 Tax=Triticum urartu TaxID=4572 RepID=A0A8R7JXE1_TRIUA